MAELRNRTPYETYQAIIDRARTFGEIGDPQGQTIFHRLLAAGASNLPKSPMEALEFLFPPPGSTGAPAVREMMRQKIARVEEGEGWAPDIHSMARDPGLQNAVLTGLMSLGAARFAGPDIRAMGTSGPRQTIRSPRHSPISEARARLLRPRRNLPGPDRVQGGSTMPYELQREAAERQQTLGDIGDETLGPGGTGVMEEPSTPRANMRSALESMTDANLLESMSDLRRRMQGMLADVLDPTDIRFRELETSYKILFNEARRRPNIPPQQPFMPMVPRNRLGSQKTPPAHPELVKARERVRARERAHEKKAAELRVPKEEGEKLGPVQYRVARTHAELRSEIDDLSARMDKLFEEEYWSDPKKSAEHAELQAQYDRLTHEADASWDAPGNIMDSPGRSAKRGDALLRERDYMEDYARIHEGEFGPLPPHQTLWYEPASHLPERVKHMTDMDLMSNYIKASKMLPMNDPERLAILRELQRRGIIPPGTRF